MLDGKASTIFGDGEQTRDFVYVDDVVQACLLALERGDGQAFNIGTGVSTSVNALFTCLASLTGYQGKPVYAAPRPGDVRHIYLGCHKAAAELGWRPQTALDAGLRNTVAYSRQALAASSRSERR
jgi:UDP-glucose 4-epimerase